jgi:exosortase A
MSIEQASPRRPVQLAAVAVLLALLAISYRETLLAIGTKWFSDMTYSHGGLVVPLSLWLIWRRRAAVAATEWCPSWWGVAALCAASLAWLVASAAGVLVVQELAVVAMVSSVVLAVLGWSAYRQLAFPVGFLVFAVPFGRGLVPSLMQVTADIAAAALRWTGVPVYRSGMLLSIPGGDFEVARACSGLNYVITGIVLGSLYAYLTYSDWRKRIAFVAASVVVLVVANGIRAYLIVTIAHWSDMRYGTGYDHIVFGRVLILAVMVVMFWIGQRWRDPQAAPGAMGMAVPPSAARTPRRVTDLVVATCLLLIVATPWYMSSATARSNAKAMLATSALALPAGQGAWRGPRDEFDSWRPLFRGAVTERATTYLGAAGQKVELYVGVYALGRPGEGEMISYHNRFYPQEHRSLLAEHPVEFEVSDGAMLGARELVIPEPRGDRVVWYWFMIGEEVTTSRTAAKALEALALISGRAALGRVITLTTPAGDADLSRRRLGAFVLAHGPCVRHGFAPGHCAA